jgi:hypothetical protein
MGKELCLREFIKDQKNTMEILMGDILTSAIVASLCVVCLVGIGIVRTRGKVFLAPIEIAAREENSRLTEAIKALTL